MPSSRLEVLINNANFDSNLDKKATKKNTQKSKTSAKKVKTDKKEKEKQKTTNKATKKVSKETKNKSIKKSKEFKDIPEYYDLPYKYENTIIKVLYQNPNLLFAYWDISDKDIKNLQKIFGEDFFNKTKPILVVTNLTKNYSFEVEINDFASNWYIRVDDSKCKYSIELIRKPLNNNSNNTDNNELIMPVNIINSNTIEIPNDHILFFKDNQKISFKNTSTDEVTEINYNKDLYENNVRNIYSNFDLSEEENRFDFNNPSSQNPTSNIM